jgi:aspartate aminotransferase-like enzyme
MGAMFIAETEGRLAELASLRCDRPARALELARGALEHVEAAGGMAPVQALLLRVSGIAQAQEGNVEAALESLEHSLRVALAADAAYEIALTLSIRGRIRQDPGDVRTAQELLNGLGVVSTPTVPLP